jgi:Flp pilus assembly protein TadG
MATRYPHHQSGAAVVEFALVLTMLLLLLGGMYDFGKAFWYYDALTKATRDGARVLSTASKATILTAGVPAAKQRVVDAAVAANLPGFNSSYVTVSCLDAAYALSACADGIAPGGVKVEISGYKLNVGDVIPLPGMPMGDITLAPRTIMRYML